MGRVIVASLAASVLVTGCQTPQLTEADTSFLPASYDGESSTDAFSAAAVDWREMFPDAHLSHLIEISLDNNRDLRLAVLDAEAAQAQLRIQRASFWPQFGLVADYTRGRVGGGTDAGEAPSTFEQGTAGIAMTAFEIDLFGRVRAQTNAAFANYLAAEAGADAARIVLISTVADAYITTLAAAAEEALIADTLKDWRASSDLTTHLYEAGQASAEDMAQAEAQVHSAEADLEAARRFSRRARNALALAAGVAVPAGLPETTSLEAFPLSTDLPPGMPSDLLTRRPDIRQAEFSLRAARANVRVARAAFFPSLTLTGQAGFASTDLENLFTGAARTWSMTPRISAPLFEAGRLEGQLDLAAIRSNAAVAQYERTIQQAFAEVSDGLAGAATFGRQMVAQEAAVAAMQKRAGLAEARYRAGLASRLELLDAQRELYGARRTLLALRAAALSNTVFLYRALGGPYQTDDVSSS